MSAIRLPLPTFGGITAVSNTKAAVRMAAKLCAKYGPEEAERRLAAALACRVSSDGRIIPPPGLSLGFEMTAVEDGRGGEYALFRPSAESGLSGPATVTAVFENPGDDLALILVGSETEKPKTLTASFLIRSVPAKADGLEKTIRRLAVQVPAQVRPAFKRAFLEALRAAVQPPDMDERFVRRQAVVTVPAAYASRRYKHELTALLNREPLAPGQAAAVIYAALAGRPTDGPFQGDPVDLLWEAAPFNPGPRDKRFWASGMPFLFYYIEPYLTDEDVKALLGLDLDYLLTIEMVLGQAKAQILARGRDTDPGRDSYFKGRLERLCQVVKPITGRDDVVQAHYLFQPGNVPRIIFHQRPVTDLRWLLRAFTQTISKLVADGDIWVGNERSGARHMVKLGHPKRGGGMMHYGAVGEGTSGKTTQLLKIAFQIAGNLVVMFTFNAAEDEGFPGAAWEFVTDDWETRTEEAYLEDGGKRLKEGVHLISVPPRTGFKARREWVVVLRSDRDMSLREVFDERVPSIVEKWLADVRIPQDLPIIIRPHETCNMALFAALVATLWSGTDPWGKTYNFGSLRARIKEFLKGIPLEEGARCVVIYDDIVNLPPTLGDPNDDARRCTEAVQRDIRQITGVDHKDGFHLGVGGHSMPQLEDLLPGTLDQLHRLFLMGEEKDGPITHRVAVMVDPKRRGEAIVTLRVDLSPWPPLVKLLTREV